MMKPQALYVGNVPVLVQKLKEVVVINFKQADI